MSTVLKYGGIVLGSALLVAAAVLLLSVNLVATRRAPAAGPDRPGERLLVATG